MPQSLVRLHIHLVFSTKKRERIITDEVRGSLHSYMAGILWNIGCAPVLINSVEDHAHLLFNLGRTTAVSRAVEEVKRCSSKWIKTQGPEFGSFAWQCGYGAFAVSESGVEPVRRYIARQREHHMRRTFQQEHRAMLHRHNIAFDERYVWD